MFVYTLWKTLGILKYQGIRGGRVVKARKQSVHSSLAIISSHRERISLNIQVDTSAVGVNTSVLHYDPTQLANNFGEYVMKKIDLIEDSIGNIQVTPPCFDTPAPVAQLDDFFAVIS